MTLWSWLLEEIEILYGLSLVNFDVYVPTANAFTYVGVRVECREVYGVCIFS